MVVYLKKLETEAVPNEAKLTFYHLKKKDPRHQGMGAEDGEDHLKVKSVMAEDRLCGHWGTGKWPFYFSHSVWRILRVLSIKGPRKALSDTQSTSKCSLNINPQIPSTSAVEM